MKDCKTQLFSTEEEMQEWFEENIDEKLKSFQITKDGILAFYEIENNSENVETFEKKDKFVYTSMNGKRLYVSDKSVTFQKTSAKTFTYEEAKTKAKAMSRRGAYKWNIE